MSEPIVLFDEKAIKNELRELVRQTVEDTLNGLLEEEADDLVGAGRYERTADREVYRAGHARCLSPMNTRTPRSSRDFSHDRKSRQDLPDSVKPSAASIT